MGHMSTGHPWGKNPVIKKLACGLKSHFYHVVIVGIASSHFGGFCVIELVV
jgi:hypothetical protein